MTKHRSTLPRIFPILLIAGMMPAQNGGPAISSVAPNSVPVNSAATPVTISGSNFANGATVSFTPPGGVAMTIVPDQVQASQIAATIPAPLLTTVGTAQIAVQSGVTLTNQLPFTITQATTTTTLISSANPSVYGQSLTLSATVTPSTATGTVNFMDGATTVCNGSLFSSNSTATANCDVTTLTAGSHSITAVYAGDTNDLGSTSQVLTQTISVATPTLAIISSANPAAVNQNVTLVGAIIPTIATGTVTFKDGQTILGTGSVSSAGTAKLVVPEGFSFGTHSLTALYSGDANDRSVSSATLNQAVESPGSATMTALGASVNPSNLGQSVTLTATLTPPGATGNVTFYNGTGVLGTVGATGGQASLTTKLMPFGTLPLNARFGLGATYGASASTLSHTVQALPASGFAQAASTGANGGGYVVAVADFNGDGKADFVYPNFSGVQVVLGNGDGTFQNPVFYSAGTDAQFVATGDFNGDGKTDLVVPNLGSNTVSVLLGNGDGTFGTSVAYPAGADAFFVAVADFNGDGKADLAVSSNQSGNVSVLLGNGDGTFQAAAGYTGGEDSPLWSVVPGDFNGDGKVDLAVGDSGGVNVLLGNGDGTFQAPISSPDTGNPLFYAVGDFNGDGKLDLAASANLGSAGNAIQVFLGNGDGTFQAPTPYGVGTQTGSFAAVVTGDFNGDGKFDLAVPNPGSGNISVLLGNGDGTFQPAVPYGVVGTTPQAIGVADFNGDNRTDLVVNGVGNFSVLLGIPGAGLTSTSTVLTSSLNPSVSGQTITLTATVTPSTATGTVTFQDGTTSLGTGTLSGGIATYTTSMLATGTHSLTAVYAGDANDTGSTSSVLTQTVSVLPPSISGLMPASARAGGPAFTLTVNGANFESGATVNWGATALPTTFVSATQLTASVAAGQIASAGPVSVTVVNPDTGMSNASIFTVNPSLVSTTMLFESPGSPSQFGQVLTLTANVSPATATGKVTFYEGTSVLGIGTVANGVAQLGSLLPAGSGTLKAYYGGDANYAPSTSGTTAQTVNPYPSGTLTPTASGPINVGMNAVSLALADFNGDGIQDFAVANSGSNNVSVLLGDGHGGFSQVSPTSFATGGGPGSLVVGDFNGDGIPDFATSDFTSNTITVMLGNSSNGFSTAPGSPLSGFGSGALVVGDFNRDGIEDLALSNGVILLGNGAGGFGAAPGSPVPGVGGVSIAMGDFNGDGIPDLVVPSMLANTATVLIGDGSGRFTATLASPIPAGSGPISAGVGDFNGDGYQDLAIADYSGNPAQSITVLLGDGHGGFNPAMGSPFAGGSNPKSIAVGDVNGDGIQDLAIASDVSGNAVTVLLGNGLGGFSPAVGGTFASGASHTSVVIGDFNGDGRADLLTTTNGNSVTALLGGFATTSSLLSTTSPASVPFGTPVPLILTVSDTVTALNPPTSGATFSDGGTVLGVAAQTASPYTFNATNLAVGPHTLTATYNGDARSTASASNSVTITVTSTNPTISGLSPFSATAGGPSFTLSVFGSNFVAGSTVQWGTTALATTFVSANQLTAPVSAAQIASAGPVSVTVVNPGPISSAVSTFTILAPTPQTWTQLLPTGGPPAARDGATAVFVPSQTTMIVFGGNGGPGVGLLNDSWALNTATNQWNPVNPGGTPPSARIGMTAVADTANLVMTIFGGGNATGCLNDVWTLSNSTGAWAQLSPTGAPPTGRNKATAVYDPGSNRMIVFGGDNACNGNATAFYNDVWVLTNANGIGGTPAWTQLAPTGTPPAGRVGASSVYDPVSNEMIVFGGSIVATVNDVWVLTNANGLGGTPAWVQLTPAGGTIPPHAYHTAVYDPASNIMTVFGGQAGRLPYNDTWVLTNANNLGGTPTWTELAPTGALPAARTLPTAVLDPTTNRMIVFSGNSNPTGTALLNDVWALTDANNVTPAITSLSPNSVTAGGVAFTLTVNGQGFAAGAVVNWNGAALTTTFVSSGQLTAAVPGNLIAALGMANVTAVNPGGATSAAATFTINSAIQPLSITSGAPPNGMVNAAYGPFTLTASGGSGSYLWSASGVPGVSVNGATGVLSGMPTAAGNQTLTVTLTDAANSASSISRNYSMTIAAGALTITTSSLPGGVQNQAYSASLAGSGGSGSYSWAISGIAGLTVNASSGAIGGSPTVGGNLSLTVTLSDALNPGATPATRQYTVAIGFAPLTITTSGALGEFAPNAAISITFAATGGSPSYTWSATGVPATLTLNPSTGQITGNAPAKPGNYSFPLKVGDTETPVATDSTTVRFSVLGITTSTTLPSGTTATPYSLNFIAAGGTPPYTFSSPNVPAGLTLSSSGFLTGTPAKPTTSSFQVLLTDATAATQVSGTFSLTVGTGVQPIQVTGAALPDGTLTTSYSQPLEAQDGKPAYSWTLLGGALPPGLALSSAGTISGTPTATGTATFTARATDSAGGFASGVFTINVDPAPLQVTVAALPNAMAGLPYGAQPISATGGFPPYTFALTQGSLPAPLTFGSGQINGGVPAAAGPSNFTVTVTDATGNTASGSFTLLVEPTQPDLILSQGSVSFSLVTGAVTLPAAANVTVGSSVNASLGYNVQVNPPAPWLDVTPNGSTPAAVIIALDPANAPPLGVGVYQTTVTVTCLPFSGCSGSHNIAVSLTVTAPAPQLSVGTNLLSFSATGNGSQTLAQPLNLENSGGGVVTIQSVSAADSWVKFDPATIPPPPVPLSAAQTLQVNVFADTTVLSAPGYYQSTITVTTDAGTATVPVTLLIAANATMTLAPAGSQFNTVAGNAPGNSNGSFLVTVSGSSAVNWTAAILPTSPAAAWLTLNTPSGSSTSASPGAVNFAINGAVTGLAAQAYYATIEVTVTGGGVTDPVQDYQVVLNVAPAGNIGAPNPNPSGLIFISTGPGALPAQIVQVGSSSGGVPYKAQSDSPAWLSVTPGLGNTSSSSPGQSSVSVNTAGLANGVYHGGINYAIAAQVRTVNVTLIVAAPAAGAAAISGIPGKAVSPACTPTQIIPTQTGLVNNFSLPTAWPTPLQINVVDDCGNAVTNGQVVATFSNDDPPLVLPGVGGSAGVYSGTWTPRATASQVTITAQASAQGFKPASVQITGQVTRNGAPVLNPGGTLNAFVPVVGSPLAPGMIVQIYGSNMASQVTLSSTIPLTTSLNNTSVIIGGIEAPLYYVSPGQINAQVPFELAQGGSYEVIVSANGALSTPIPIQIAGDAPGIAAFPSGGIIAQHGDGTLVTDAAPAAPGEYIVFYVSGMGQTNNPVASGAASPGSPNLATPTDPPTLTLNGVNVPVAFAGLTPTLVGLYQVNFQVPANTPNGDLQLVLTQTGGQSNSTILAVHN